MADPAAVLGRVDRKTLRGKLIVALLTPDGPTPKREIAESKREIYKNQAGKKSAADAFRKLKGEANIWLRTVCDGTLQIERAGRGWVVLKSLTVMADRRHARDAGAPPAKREMSA